MPYSHSCFISYAHGQRELMRTFVEQLVEGFQSELEAYFRDEDLCVDYERLQPGYQYNTALAHSICRSVAMVVVYTPAYERSDYCLREYAAMLKLQQKRLAVLPGPDAGERGFVIPVVLRGRLENLPESIRHHTHYADFRHFTTADRRLVRNRRYVGRIGEVAEYIYGLHQALCAAGVEPEECDAFKLPGKSHAKGFGGGAPPSAAPLRA